MRWIVYESPNRPPNDRQRMINPEAEQYLVARGQISPEAGALTPEDALVKLGLHEREGWYVVIARDREEEPDTITRLRVVKRFLVEWNPERK